MWWPNLVVLRLIFVSKRSIFNVLCQLGLYQDRFSLYERPIFVVKRSIFVVKRPIVVRKRSILAIKGRISLWKADFRFEKVDCGCERLIFVVKRSNCGWEKVDFGNERSNFVMKGRFWLWKVDFRCEKVDFGCHGHGHGHGHGRFILATHSEGIWTTNRIKIDLWLNCIGMRVFHRLLRTWITVFVVQRSILVVSKVDFDCVTLVSY